MLQNTCTCAMFFIMYFLEINYSVHVHVHGVTTRTGGLTSTSVVIFFKGNIVYQEPIKKTSG